MRMQRLFSLFCAVLLAVIVANPATAQRPHDGGSRKPAAVKKLPKNYHKTVVRGNPFYFWGGHFYKRSGSVYVGISAPLGAIIPALPGGFVTIGVGAGRYYRYGDVYYRSAPNGYEVVAAPSETTTSTPITSSAERLIVYPANGQSEEETGRDRYECHLWAVKDTGFDPTMSDTDTSAKSDYRRAQTACLEARGYVVK